MFEIFFFFFFQKFAGLWLVGKVDNHVAIYGSKVAEGFSAFQRRLVFVVIFILCQLIVDSVNRKCFYVPTWWNSIWICIFLSAKLHTGLKWSTTEGSTLGGPIFDIDKILTQIVNRRSRSHYYLGCGHFIWLFWFHLKAMGFDGVNQSILGFTISCTFPSGEI